MQSVKRTRILCYLAHPVTLYGSEEQVHAIESLEREGYGVVNPDGIAHQEGYRARGMEHFTDLVSRCGALAFLMFPGGGIGAGVGKEIDAAKVAGLPVLAYVPSDGIWRDVSGLDLRPYLSVEETRAMIAAIRANGAPMTRRIQHRNADPASTGENK